MVKRGRKKVSLRKDPKKMIAYQKRKYKLNKMNNKDYGQKDSLLVMATLCVQKIHQDMQRFPKRLKTTVHRYNYKSLVGSFRIPESELGDNQSMAQYCADELGEGEFVIKSGYANRHNKRVTWRGLLRFKSRQMDNGEFKPFDIVPKTNRLRHYWFRKNKPKQ
jgi:hypothetical protein